MPGEIIADKEYLHDRYLTKIGQVKQKGNTSLECTRLPLIPTLSVSSTRRPDARRQLTSRYPTKTAEMLNTVMGWAAVAIDGALDM